MTTQQALNTIGLGLGMAGCVILFYFGPPQPSFEEGVGLGLQDGNVLEDGRTVAEHNRDAKALRARYSSWSKVGLGLVFAGFGLQLWATWA